MRVFSDAEMDAAVAKFRSMKSVEEYYAALNDPSDFRVTLEAAYARDPSFMRVDAAGWNPARFNVDVPPALPIVNGAPELDPTERERRRKPISGAAFPS